MTGAMTIAVLGDSILAAALVADLGARHAVTWVRRRRRVPAAAPALIAPATPTHWLADPAATRAAVAAARTWMQQVEQDAGCAIPHTLAAVALTDPTAPPLDLHLILTTTRRLWTALHLLATRRATQVIVSSRATPLFDARQRCSGIRVRGGAVRADLVILAVGPNLTPTLWRDPAHPVPPHTIMLHADPDAPLGWRIRLRVNRQTYTTTPPHPAAAPVPGVTPMPGAPSADGVRVHRGLIIVSAFGSHGISAIPRLLATLTTLIP